MPTTCQRSIELAGGDVPEVPKMQREYQTSRKSRAEPRNVRVMRIACAHEGHRASNCTTVPVRSAVHGKSRSVMRRTPVRPLFVHDTMTALPAADGLTRLDLVRGAAIYRKEMERGLPSAPRKLHCLSLYAVRHTPAQR